MRARQEMLNAKLARQLVQRGLVALPERVLSGSQMPDVLLILSGLHGMLGGEVDDQPRAQQNAWNKAVKRVEGGLAHLAIAVVYPAKLRLPAPEELGQTMCKATLRFALYAAPVPETPNGSPVLSTILQTVCVRRISSRFRTAR